MRHTLRFATPDDAPAIAAIYAPFVNNTAITFATEPPTQEEMAEHIKTTLARFPWLVAEHNDAVQGYAYASAHRVRSAYQWSVEVSVYIHPQAQRQGIARALYTALFCILTQQNYCNAYAGITLPNRASVALHESLGFQSVALYPRVGYKQGQWHDVGWWHRVLHPHTDMPAPPRPWRVLSETQLAQCLG
jgi:phosphinothricin acetyltransferase